MIWVGANLGGEVGVVVTYVAVNLGLAFGYASIAHRVFFHSIFLKVKQEVLVFAGIALISFAATALLDPPVFAQEMMHLAGTEQPAILRILVFGALFVLALQLHKSTRHFYLNSRFFEFTPTLPSADK